MSNTTSDENAPPLRAPRVGENPDAPRNTGLIGFYAEDTSGRLHPARPDPDNDFLPPCSEEPFDAFAGRDIEGEVAWADAIRSEMAETRSRIDKDHNKVDPMYADLFEAVENGRGREVKELNRDILNCQAAKRLGAYGSQTKRNKQRRTSEPYTPNVITLGKLDRIVNSIDMLGPCREHKIVFFLPKANGSSRMICAFGEREHARQTLLASILEVSGAFKDTQVQSVPDIVEVFDVGITEMGFTHAVCFDIADCYGSLNPWFLVEECRLPNPTVKHVLLPIDHGIRSIHWPPDHIHVRGVDADQVSSGPFGLPQGSAASPVAARILVSLLMKGLNVDGLQLVYVDDGLILVRGEREARQVRNALVSHVEGENRIGRITLKTAKVVDLRLGVDFLGVNLKAIDGVPLASPGAKAIRGLKDRLDAEALGSMPLEAIEATLEQWTNQRHGWGGAPRFLNEVCDHLHTRAFAVSDAQSRRRRLHVAIDHALTRCSGEPKTRTHKYIEALGRYQRTGNPCPDMATRLIKKRWFAEVQRRKTLRTLQG